MSKIASPRESAVRRSVGQRIRSWRTQRGYSQYALAEVIGVTQGAVSNYETGKRDIPLTVASAIASELDVSLGDFTGGRPSK